MFGTRSEPDERVGVIGRARHEPLDHAEQSGARHDLLLPRGLERRHREYDSAPAPPAVPLNFRTLLVPALGCPCSIWSAGTTPSIASAADANAIEVGVKFKAAANGFITALRFYKGPRMAGPM